MQLAVRLTFLITESLVLAYRGVFPPSLNLRRARVSLGEGGQTQLTGLKGPSLRDDTSEP